MDELLPAQMAPPFRWHAFLQGLSVKRTIAVTSHSQDVPACLTESPCKNVRKSSSNPFAEFAALRGISASRRLIVLSCQQGRRLNCGFR